MCVCDVVEEIKLELGAHLHFAKNKLDCSPQSDPLCGQDDDEQPSS